MFANITKSLVALSLVLSIFAPARSEALVLLTNDDRVAIESPIVFLSCILLLPLCLLGDDKTVQSATPQDLLDNGYTVEEIAAIQSGQERLVQYLNAHGMKDFTQAPGKQSVAARLQQLIPNIEPEFVQFYTEGK